MTTSISARYKVVRRLGSGGMGEVFLAQDTELDRPVAIKVMSPELAKDSNQRKRFRTEARSSSGLVHPHVCVIHEVGETEDGRPYLAMEYLEGETLDQVMMRRKLKLREVIRVGIQVADALEAAHARGIVHRDIKPGNIMLNGQGNAKVLDFGLAKRLGQDALSDSSSTAAVTRSDMMIGTPHYMSPEQVLGRQIDSRSDVFSVGVVLYEMVAGQKPFRGKTIGEVINAVVNEIPEPLGLESPMYSPTLDGIIFKCLEKDPEKRYESGAGLAADLRRLQEDSERAALAGRTSKLDATQVAPRADPQPTKLWQLTARVRQRAPVAIWILLAGAVTLGVFGAWWVRQGRKQHGRTALQTLAATPVVAPAKSVAVLPFDNFIGEPETDYLSDGLTEEITTALSRIEGLKVAARNSAFAFKGKKENIRTIGEALGVSTVLEGSVRKSGNMLRVSAQLVSVKDGFHLWSESYEASLDDIFVVQKNIARRIAERLSGHPLEEQATQHVVDPGAYRLYMQARQFWNRRSEAGLKRATQLFQEALASDGAYADAYSGLAATYLVYPLYVPGAKMQEYRPLAEAAARRAKELDPGCAEAYAVSAELKAAAGDPEGAEADFKKAIELSPSHPTVYHWYGRFLDSRQRRKEGLICLQKAIELDPLSAVIQSTIPEYYYHGRDYDTAIERARKVIELFPDFYLVRRILVAAQIKRGLYADALKEIEQLRVLQPENPRAELEMKAYVLARTGQEAEARKLLTETEALQAAGRPVEGELLWMYLGLGERDKAMDLIEQAVAKGEMDPHYADDPFLEELRDHPRFQRMLARMQAATPG